MNSIYLIGLFTLIAKEYNRIVRIWSQTFLPPIITVALYFLIFGNLIGPRIGEINHYPYMQYIAPGLIMMTIITNSYANVSSSFYSARFQRSIEEVLISPMPNSFILLGYVLGGVVRGGITGLLVTVVALFFTHLSLHSIFVTLLTAFLSAILFSLAGFTNGLFANKFDDIAIIPTFILTPLTYLGGVFYSISMLPPFWEKLSHLNPIVYMVNTFRFGILGVTDINLTFAFGTIIFFIVVLFSVNLYLLEKGVGIRD